MVTKHISPVRLLCQLASRRTDSAVRHHDSKPYSETARTPPAYTLPLSRSGMSRELKILAAQRAKGLGRLLEPSLHVVMVGQVVVEQRAEVHERLRETDGAATVEPQVRGVASALGARPSGAEHGLGLDPLFICAYVHQEAKEAKVVVHRVGRRQKGLA